MTALLRVAAVYNLAWGLIAFALPTQLFAWGGLPAPNYPSLVRMLGMIVVVFAIGYALAARDPAAQWRIVALGLLGKVFGTIVFVGAAVNAELPWSLGLIGIANEVVWWLPFALILDHARRVQYGSGSSSSQKLRCTR